jgi:hypothetical protein
VWGSSGSDVFAVGDGDTILHYDGADWSAMSSGTYHRLYGVWGSSDRDVFAVGGGGAILHYSGPPNRPPVATPDWYRLDEDTPLSVSAPGVLGNDYDPDGDALTAVLDSPPLSGTLDLRLDGSLAYTPTAGFLGVDAFRYHAEAGGAASNVTTVTLTVRVPPLAWVYLPVVYRER